MTKSYVGIGFDYCPICYKKHNEVVLLDQRLKDSLERDNFMDFSLCPQHKAMREEYLALVECTNVPTKGNLKPEDAQPTGRYAHVRRKAAKFLFNVDLPTTLDFVYCSIDVIDKLEKLRNDAPEESWIES